MTVAIFAIGIVVFLITVYGTVVAGGLLLTDRQLDDQPELTPESLPPHHVLDTAARARAVVNADF